MTDIEAMQERIIRHYELIGSEVGDFQPKDCCWLESDASASYCWKHAVAARAEELPIPPGWEKPWYRRTDEEADACTEFDDGIGCSSGGESDHAETCDTCGELLSYSLTDYGRTQELEFMADPDVRWIGIGITPEVAYSACKALWDSQYSDDRAELELAVKAGWAVLAQMAHTY